MDKSTKELLETMKTSKSYGEYLEKNRKDMTQSFMKIDRAINTIISEKNLKKADVIAKSGIEVHYAYQILSGKKVPTRDKVVALCYGLRLTVEETQNLLKITGYPQLYGKNERDNAIIYGIEKKLSIIELNVILYDLKLDTLS